MHWIRTTLLRLLAGRDVVVMNTTMTNGEIEMRDGQAGIFQRVQNIPIVADSSRKPWWLE